MSEVPDLVTAEDRPPRGDVHEAVADLGRGEEPDLELEAFGAANQEGHVARWMALQVELEVCEARLRVRPSALYILQQELVSVRGRRSWRHILQSGVRDDEQDRWVGECVCRPALSVPRSSSQ